MNFNKLTSNIKLDWREIFVKNYLEMVKQIPGSLFLFQCSVDHYFGYDFH